MMLMPKLRIEAINLRSRDIITLDGFTWQTITNVTRHAADYSTVTLWLDSGGCREVASTRLIIVKI
jgi:hypothetical protein